MQPVHRFIMWRLGCAFVSKRPSRVNSLVVFYHYYYTYSFFFSTPFVYHTIMYLKCFAFFPSFSFFSSLYYIHIYIFFNPVGLISNYPLSREPRPIDEGSMKRNAPRKKPTAPPPPTMCILYY